MSDVVLNPTFPPDEFAKYQKRQLAQVEQMRSRSAFLAQERFHKVLYGDFAAAVVSATPESLKAMTPAQLKDFHDRYYVPNNAILGVVGDVQFDQVVSLHSETLRRLEEPSRGSAGPGEDFAASGFQSYSGRSS